MKEKKILLSKKEQKEVLWVTKKLLMMSLHELFIVNLTVKTIMNTFNAKQGEIMDKRAKEEKNEDNNTYY